MKKEDFYKNILISCELDESLASSTKIEDVEEWDSLAFITLLSLFKKYFKIKVGVNELKECKTFDEILSFGDEYYEK